ncbi:hypothetical protein AKO1_011473 [Acrasis kona]|uniref:Saposin B-type domain-containing protein n=1 Tax=Acrasis kona TaxID=1008807 RepID=A0AAW2Z3M5_9EUKA
MRRFFLTVLFVLLCATISNGAKGIPVDDLDICTLCLDTVASVKTMKKLKIPKATILNYVETICKGREDKSFCERFTSNYFVVDDFIKSLTPMMICETIVMCF